MKLRVIKEYRQWNSHEWLVVLGVVDHDELQPTLGGDQVAEVDALDHLVVGRVYGHDLGTASADGLLQGVDNAHVQGPQKSLRTEKAIINCYQLQLMLIVVNVFIWFFFIWRLIEMLAALKIPHSQICGHKMSISEKH